MTSTESFAIHDLASFPFVRMKAGVATPGYAAQWKQEMDGLLERAHPFVMLHGASTDEETHADKKERGVWLKQHKETLQRYCLGMIGIEADPLKRHAMKAISAMATKAFGIPTYVVATDKEAATLARRLIDTNGVATDEP